MKTMLFKMCKESDGYSFEKEIHEVHQLDTKKICKLIDCTLFDRTVIYILDRPFDVLVDDTGLLTDKPTFQIGDNQPLAGNLLFVGRPDEEGNLTSLTSSQLDILELL